MTNNDTINSTPTEFVDIQLSLNEYDDAAMSDFQKEFLTEELSQFSSLENGQISIEGVYTFDKGDKLEVSVYMRNGLDKKINFDKLPLVIVDLEDKILAKQIIDMKDLGILPPHTARPYKVYFDKENVLVDTISKDNWKIKIENQINAFKSVKTELEEMSDNLPYELKNGFETFLNKLPLTKSGNVDIDVFKTVKNMDDSISIVFIIRNGCDQRIKLDKLPITIKDAENNMVAGGAFEIDNVQVNPHKARIYDFTIKSQNIYMKDFDIDKCKVFFTY